MYNERKKNIGYHHLTITSSSFCHIIHPSEKPGDKKKKKKKKKKDLNNVDVHINFGQILSICSRDIERKRNSDINQGP